MTKLACIVAALTLTALTACTTQRVEPSRDSRLIGSIDEIGNRAINEHNIVGLSIAINIDNKPYYAKGFGHADIDRSIPATPGTIYDIASIGKQYTAVAILTLVQDGAINLDDRIRDHIPDLPPHFPNATVEQLLRHTSGFVGAELNEFDPPESYKQRRYGAQLFDDIEFAQGQALFEPESTWIYCNPGYLMLGIIVERASGMRYDEYVRHRLLEPIALHDVYVCERAQPTQMAQAISYTDNGHKPIPFIDMTAFSGQGSICSSAIDLLRWSHALNSKTLLTPKSLKMFRSPSPIHSEHTTTTVPYGMAQRIGKVNNHPKVGHTGTFEGGSASLSYLPNDNIEIAVLTNTYGNGTPHARSIELEVILALLSLTMDDLVRPTKPLTDEMKHAIEGTYSDGRPFHASFEDDTLIVTFNDEQIERLNHIGALRFQDPNRPEVIETFIMDNDHAGWWIYNASGSFLEVLHRVPDSQ